MVLPAYIDETSGEITDGEAWVGIASTTLTSDTTSITFTNPNDGSSLDWGQFMDLVAIAYIRAAPAHNSRVGLLSINGSSTNADYDTIHLKGDRSSATHAYESSNQWFPVLIGDASTANCFSIAITHFFDINSGKYKSWMVQSASDYSNYGYTALGAGRFLKQDSISTLKFYEDSGQGLKDKTRIDLFGVLPRMVS